MASRALFLVKLEYYSWNVQFHYCSFRRTESLLIIFYRLTHASCKCLPWKIYYKYKIKQIIELAKTLKLEYRFLVEGTKIENVAFP